MTCNTTGLYSLRLLNKENIIQISKSGYESILITITQDMVKNNCIDLGRISMLEN